MVVGTDPDDQGHLLDDVESELTQLSDLIGVVGQQAHALDPEVGEDAGGGGVVASVGGEAEGEVRVDGVEPALLQAVRPQLVDEPDPAALVPAHVDDDAAVLVDAVQRGIELRTALALLGAESFTGEALRVHAHERSGFGEIAGDDREVVGACDTVLVREESEGPVRRRHVRLRAQAHSALGSAIDRFGGGAGTVEVRDELLDRDDRDAFALAHLDQAGQAHHGAVLGDDLADRRDRLETRELHELDAGLGVTGAFPDAAVDGTQGQNVPRTDHGGGRGSRVGEHVQSVRAVGRADSGRHLVGGIHADGVRGAAGVLVHGDHRRQVQPVRPLRGHRRAEESARPADRPREPFGGGELGREDDVSLVLAVLVVGDDDGLAGAQGVEGFGDGGKARCL